jgi:hypothetical protein
VFAPERSFVSDLDWRASAESSIVGTSRKSRTAMPKKRSRPTSGARTKRTARKKPAGQGGPGRPPKPPGEVLEHQIHLRINDEVLSKLARHARALAKEAGREVSLAEAARELVCAGLRSVAPVRSSKPRQRLSTKR